MANVEDYLYDKDLQPSIVISASDYARFIRNSDRLDTLLEAILDDAHLSWDMERLIFDVDSKNTLTLVKFLFPEEYENKLDWEIVKKKEAEDAQN